MNIGLVDELGNINSAIQKAAELAGLGSYSMVYYPEKKDPLEEMLKMLDKSTPEEKLVVKIREFASQPRIMALMPEVVVE